MYISRRSTNAAVPRGGTAAVAPPAIAEELPGPPVFESASAEPEAAAEVTEADAALPEPEAEQTFEEPAYIEPEITAPPVEESVPERLELPAEEPVNEPELPATEYSGGVYISGPEPETVSEEAPQAAAEPVAEEKSEDDYAYDVKSFADNLDVQTEQIRETVRYNDAALVELNIKYPHLEWRRNLFAFPQRPLERINMFYNAAAVGFKKYAQNTLYKLALRDFMGRDAEAGEGFQPYGAVMKFEDTYRRGNLYSAYFDVYEYTGGTHGNTVRRGQAWDLSDGRLLQYGDFLSGSAECRQTALEAVWAQIERQRADGAAYSPAQFQELRPYFDAAHFYLTDGGYAVYFNLCDVAPYSAGIPVFILPYGSLGACELNPDMACEK